MVACSIGVRIGEVTRDNRPVHCRDNLGQQDLLRFTGQNVSAAYATLRTHNSGTLEGQQDLLKVGLGEARAIGDVAYRPGGLSVTVERQGQQGSACIVTTGRDLHGQRS